MPSSGEWGVYSEIGKHFYLQIKIITHHGRFVKLKATVNFTSQQIPDLTRRNQHGCNFLVPGAHYSLAQNTNHSDL